MRRFNPFGEGGTGRYCRRPRIGSAAPAIQRGPFRNQCTESVVLPLVEGAYTVGLVLVTDRWRARIVGDLRLFRWRGSVLGKPCALSTRVAGADCI